MSEKEFGQKISQMADDIREIKLAVKGDETIGLQGLVNDMSEIKRWRSSITLKVAVVSGAVSGSVLGIKSILAKMFTDQ